MGIGPLLPPPLSAMVFDTEAKPARPSIAAFRLPAETGIGSVAADGLWSCVLVGERVDEERTKPISVVVAVAVCVSESAPPIVAVEVLAAAAVLCCCDCGCGGGSGDS